jgi:hypothetical protein
MLNNNTDTKHGDSKVHKRLKGTRLYVYYITDFFGRCDDRTAPESETIKQLLCRSKTDFLLNRSGNI